jgi:hypothetical protein
MPMMCKSQVATATANLQGAMDMQRLKQLGLAAGLVCAASVAHASSPDAWVELHAKASAACTKGANMNGANVRGAPIDFEDAVLIIVDGRHPQPHMNNAKGTKYCLYRKQTAKADVSEAPASVSAPIVKARAMGRTCWNDSFGAQLKTQRPIGTLCSAKNDEGDTYNGVVRK